MALKLGNKNIAVFSIDSDRKSVRGIYFKCGGRTTVCRRAFAAFEEENGWTKAFEAVLQELDPPRECRMTVLTAFESGVVFECDLPPMKFSQLRDAISFEIPNYLLKVPQNMGFDYSLVPAKEGGCSARVHAYDRDEAASFLKFFREKHILLDEVIHPVLTLPEITWRDPVFLPELPDGLCWQEGEIVIGERPDSGGNEGLRDFVRKNLPDVELEDGELSMAPALLKVRDKRSYKPDRLNRWNLPPEDMKVRRYRMLAKSAAVLGILFVIGLAGIAVRDVATFRGEYVRLKEQTESLKEKTKKLQRELDRRDKEAKEMRRVLGLSGGEGELLQKLARLSDNLPDTVLVSNLRWNENVVDLNMMTDQENLDFSAVVKKMPYWKISRIFQRRMGDTLNYISLQLTPAEE